MYNNSDRTISFCISNDLIIVNDRSVGVRIKRDDGVFLPKYEYFPRYKKTGETLVEVLDQGYTSTTIRMPKWLHDKKIGPGFRIAIW